MNAITRARRGKSDLEKAFIDVFSETARYRSRSEVWRHFIDFSAIALHNAVIRSDRMEEEYARAAALYQPQDLDRFSHLLGLLITLLEIEPRDVLGSIYMSLELGNARSGQFFTPSTVSQMMAEMQMHDIDRIMGEKGYFTVSEPACGSGGMMLAVVKALIEKGYDPATSVFFQGIDIDSSAARMSFIQLTLWNAPAEIITGDALRLEFRDHLYTPAYYLNGWRSRLDGI